ncbi:MAG: hypothetical protein QOC80_1066, partial [Frankiaceae bacterium]|nr:hypothetical protein [Frankiaceae bacterium]
EAARRSGSTGAGAGSDTKDGKRAARDERRKQAAGYREAMMSGDVSRLPPRERVPERILARDLVDRRRNFGPIFLLLLILNFASSVVQSVGIRVLFTYLLMLGLILFVLDAVLLARTVSVAVRKRYPQSTVPVKVYSVQRALLPGRFRMPRPRGPVAGWLPAQLRDRFRRR